MKMSMFYLLAQFLTYCGLGQLASQAVLDVEHPYKGWRSVSENHGSCPCLRFFSRSLH